MTKLYDAASEVCAEQGEVHVDGPGGVALALTPEAAAEMSDRLLHGAMQAKGQQIAAGTAKDCARIDRDRHGPD